MKYSDLYEKYTIKSKDIGFDYYVRNTVLYKFFPVTNKREKVCDIAGGSGIISEWFIKRGYDATLVEFNETAIQEAKNRGVSNIIKVELDSDTVLPFNAGTFDYVFMGDIIEHLFDPEVAIKEAKRILKPRGILVLSCPNIAYWRFRSYYLIDGDLQRIDVGKQKPWEQEHIRFYNIKILKEFLHKNNFIFKEYTGVNDIWHSKYLAKFSPNLFAHTIVASFINDI